MYTRNERIIPRPIEEEMKTSYLNYAMSVIIGRALPDVRDGLKPVQRRILYAMHELGLQHGKPFKKSARIVGEVLGKYHPHGDSAVYDALVRMVQPFSLRYPLVEGQGNFGSIDGDAAAAMRYTEARLAKISQEMLRDIDKDTVDFVPNFDESLQEPTVLPAAIPNLLINGASGIAVGMATNIPPHNLGEVISALVAMIDDPNIDVKGLMRHIKGPDFPTGALICGRSGIKQAYETGRGKITLRAKAVTEKHPRTGRQSLVITEIPYQVNKSNLLATIASYVQSKKIEGISDIRDESDKEGLRIVLELKRDAQPEIVLNQLYKYTQLETTFGIILLAIVHGRPQVLTLKEMLQQFIQHRREVVTRRTRFELAKAKRRAHILEGLKIALDNIDAVIETIKKSRTTQDAKEKLIKRFSLTEVQAQAILEMQLQRLVSLERKKLEEEYLELIKRIEFLESVLASDAKLMGIIREELLEIKEKYADPRRTDITAETKELNIEDLIQEEDMVITISHRGYIKRLAVSSYRKQARGGKGVSTAAAKEGDFIEHLFVAKTLDYLLFFTNKGKAYWLKVYEIPEASRTSRGRAIVNLLSLSQGEHISTVLALRSFGEEERMCLITRNGIIKRVEARAFSHVRKGGIIAITLDKGDELVRALLTSGEDELVIATAKGIAIRFKETDVREMGRQARGVKAISLRKGDYVVGAVIVEKGKDLLTITSDGIAKRSGFEEYRLQNRGGTGLINIKLRPGAEVVFAMAVDDETEVMVITQKGMTVRCPVKDIRRTSRNTQGVRLIKMEEGDRVVTAAKVEKDE